MSNIYGVAQFAKQNSVPQVEWKNVDIIGQYIDNLQKEKQLEMMDRNYELAKDQTELYKEKFLEDVRQFELKRNTLSAKEQADIKLREKEMANAIRTAQIGASAGIAQANATNAVLKYNMDEATRARLENDKINEYISFIKDQDANALTKGNIAGWKLSNNITQSTLSSYAKDYFGNNFDPNIFEKALSIAVNQSNNSKKAY